MHDGTSPIVATAATPEDRFDELWNLLVPSGGPSATVQGEVIRIAGKIHDEWHRNGGCNWDRDFAARWLSLSPAIPTVAIDCLAGLRSGWLATLVRFLCPTPATSASGLTNR